MLGTGIYEFPLLMFFITLMTAANQKVLKGATAARRVGDFLCLIFFLHHIPFSTQSKLNDIQLLLSAVNFSVNNIEKFCMVNV